MIVLDAAAVVDVLIGAPSAGWVLGQLTDQRIRAPAHQPAEVLSALARLSRAGRLAPDDAEDAVTDLDGLRQELVPPTAAHLQRALALRERIRVTDGLYAVLAEELDCPLVTTDRRLAKADPPCRVRVPD